jgi:glycosyltransferase involved in cell wall biosynthesis
VTGGQRPLGGEGPLDAEGPPGGEGPLGGEGRFGGERPLRVAFIHLGKEGGGVPRYGRMVAESAHRDPSLDVREIDAGGRDARLGDLRRAAREAGTADVVQLQWKLADWGGGWRGLGRLAWFVLWTRRPIVATLHDVYAPKRRRDRFLRPEAWALRLVGLRARRVVVHANEERRRLKGVVSPRKLAVIPHFVEERPPLPDADIAKSELGLVGRKVVSLLGFITERKGHRLLLEALATLPPDVSVVIAGAPVEGREHRQTELEELASSLGVTDRVLFTGYVGDAMLERVLAATDVGACPFKDLSSSGSLSTWISAGTRIVASDLPAIREYDAISPGAICRFMPRTAEALAAEILLALDAVASDGRTDPGVSRLSEALAVPRIVDRYASVWRAAAP